jgi:hypothetical protein
MLAASTRSGGESESNRDKTLMAAWIEIVTFVLNENVIFQ